MNLTCAPCWMKDAEAVETIQAEPPEGWSPTWATTDNVDKRRYCPRCGWQGFIMGMSPSVTMTTSS